VWYHILCNKILREIMLRVALYTLLLGCSLATTNGVDICEFEEDGARLAHPTDCTKFIECEDSKTVAIRSCPYGLHFNRYESICDYKFRAGCDVSYALQLLHYDSDGEFDCEVCKAKCGRQVDNEKLDPVRPPFITLKDKNQRPGAPESSVPCENKPTPPPRPNSTPCATKLPTLPPSTPCASKTPSSPKPITTPCVTTPTTAPPTTGSPSKPTEKPCEPPTAPTPAPPEPTPPPPPPPSKPAEKPCGTPTYGESPPNTTSPPPPSQPAERNPVDLQRLQHRLHPPPPIPSKPTTTPCNTTPLNTSSTAPCAEKTTPKPTASPCGSQSSKNSKPYNGRTLSGRLAAQTFSSQSSSKKLCEDPGQCAGQRDGAMFSDPLTNGFIVCRTECEIKMTCPKSLVYNPKLRVCDWPRD
ncbi:hypothetical protein DOY81_014824, partial [Sarcophaga bullata]